MHKLKSLYEESPSPAHFARGHLDRMCDLLGELDETLIGQMVEIIDAASHEGRRVYVIGNGGSAAVASHMVNDFAPNSYVEGEPPFRFLSLSDNAESVTAVANDREYDEIFVHQLRVHLEPNDLLIAMSVSGNSENVIRAADFALERGAQVIGLCGFDGGRLAERASPCLVIKSTTDEYGPVEDVFSVVNHIVSGYLTMKRGRYLHH
jgi:D-sedoheptulose 7-phosphate isomerase